MNLLFNFKGKEVEWSGEAFEKMKNLRLLSFCRGVMFSQGPKCLPNSLRVVQWDHYPSSTLPDDFCPINLVILRLRYSHLKTLGKAFKNFNNLRQLNLGFSKDLEELPDISGAVNLEELEVSYCQNLTKIDDSVGRLTKLRMLNAQRCISLDTFIVKGMELVSLEVLNLSYCFELHTFPKILVPMKNIKTFDMSHTAIKTLPESIEKLDALERLSNNYHRFDQPDLRTLYLVNCLQLQEIREVPPNIKIFSLTSSSIRTLLKQNCYNLRELDLSYNKNLEEFPDISEAVNLEVLDVSYCKKLTKIDDSVGHFAKLRILNAKKCISLDTFIVKGIKLVSLEILNLSNCSNLHIFPEILVTMEKIETLDLSYTAIKILPESIEKLIALETLCLSDSTELRQLPNLACRNLKRLDLNGCKKLEEIKGISQDIEVFSAKNCTSLTSCTTRLLLRQKFFNLCKLNLQGCESLEELPDIFEAANLQELNVSHCKKLTKINDSIGHLAKLKVLNAEGCEMLDTFIVGGIMLVSLEILNLRCCYKLHTFPKILGTMKNIVILDLGHTAITLLPESMEKLVALERLLLREIKGDLSDDRNPFRFDESTLYLDGCDQLQEIRKIPPNIKVFFAENCKSLTSSFVRTLLKQKIFNLCELTLQDCENLEELPDISGAANLKKLNVGYCKKLTKIDDSVGHLNKLKVLNAEECGMLDTFIVGGIKLVSLEILILRRCYKLHTFPEILETMEKIKTLDLSHTAIKTLPKSIENFVALEALYLSSCKELRQLPNLSSYHNLKTLDLDLCKELKEIKGISPDIEVFSAKNCTSLTSCTTRLLLRQELQETGKTEFVMPGNEIPKWLHKHSTGGSVSFWVRRKFPQIALCAVVTGGPPIYSSFVMHINGVTKYVVKGWDFRIEIDHIFLFDLWKQDMDFGIYVAIQLLAKGWNHFKFSLEGGGTESRLKYIGVHVYNYDSCMEDILFENPIPQERIQVEAVHKIGYPIWDNNEEEIIDLPTETDSDVEKKKGQLKVDDVNSTLSSSLAEPSSDTTSHYDMQQQQHLTSINQQISESSEIIKKTKGKDIIVYEGNANEEKGGNTLEVTYQNYQISSNSKSLNWDPMTWEHQLMSQKDQRTIIDQVHDERASHYSKDLQQQQHLTSIHQQIPKSFENVKKAKGKDIMVYGGNSNEKQCSNTLEGQLQEFVHRQTQEEELNLANDKILTQMLGQRMEYFQDKDYGARSPSKRTSDQITVDHLQEQKKKIREEVVVEVCEEMRLREERMRVEFEERLASILASFQQGQIPTVFPSNATSNATTNSTVNNTSNATPNSPREPPT